MKGKIRWFDTEGGDTLGYGGVDAANGKQYEFEFDEWRGGMWVPLPEVGMEVVFGTDENRARDIYLDDRVHAIVRQFPGPVTFRPTLRTRAKWAGLLLVSGLFAVGRLFILSRGDPAGWIVIILGGLGAIAPALNFVTGEGTLTLDKDGFEFKESLRRQRIKWDASLLLGNADADRSKEKSRDRIAFMIKPDNFGFTPIERLRIMTDWCNLAIADDEQPPARAPRAPAGVSEGARFQE